MTVPGLFLSAVIPLLAAAIPVNQPKGFLSLEIRRTTTPRVAGGARDQARSIPEANLTDMAIIYVADIAIGSPQQPMTLIVDTGSSSLWVNPNCVYAQNQQICYTSVQYDPTESMPAPKRVPELDGYQDYSSGEWVEMEGYSDVFWLDDDTKVLNQAFGLANDSQGVYLGYLGLGPDLVTGFDSDISNYSLLNSMVDQGMINSRTFSLGLEETLTDGAESPRSLIFGGVDKNMFKNKFVSLPVQQPGHGGGDDLWRFWVQMSGVSHTLANGTRTAGFNFTGENATYIMDSATTGIYLPSDTVSSIMAEMNLDWTPSSFSQIDCDTSKSPGSFTFTFGDFDITVPYSTLILEDTPGSCLFLITSVFQANATDLLILGLGFMRAAYTVFDWDNEEVYLAERAHCGQGTDAVAIPAGQGAVSAIEGNCT